MFVIDPFNIIVTSLMGISMWLAVSNIDDPRSMAGKVGFWTNVGYLIVMHGLSIFFWMTMPQNPWAKPFTLEMYLNSPAISSYLLGTAIGAFIGLIHVRMKRSGSGAAVRA